MGLPLDTQACRAMMEQKKTQAQNLAQSLQAEAQRAGFEPRRKKGKKYSPLLNPDSSQDVLAYLLAQGHKISSTREEDLKELSQAGSSFAGRSPPIQEALSPSLLYGGLAPKALSH